jgi:hypothetical protein
MIAGRRRLTSSLLPRGFVVSAVDDATGSASTRFLLRLAANYFTMLFFILVVDARQERIVTNRAP